MLGKPAQPRPRDHPVARLKPRSGGRHYHFARRFHAWHERQRGLELVFAAGHQQVGEVERGGADPDQGFAWRGFGYRQIGQRAPGVGGRERLDLQRLHGA